MLASPGTGGGTTTISYGGKAGDLVISLISLGQDSLFLPELAGTLVLPIMPILISHGPASGSGTLGVSVPLPTLPPGIEAFTVYAQAAAISGVGAAVLCAPSQLTIPQRPGLGLPLTVCATLCARDQFDRSAAQRVRQLGD